MNVNEFECCAFCRSTNSAKIQQVLWCSFFSVAFTYLFLLSVYKNAKEIFQFQQKTFERATKFRLKRCKNQLCAQQMTEKTTKRTYTNVQKSHFYLLLAPFHLTTRFALSLVRFTTKAKRAWASSESVVNRIKKCKMFKAVTTYSHRWRKIKSRKNSSSWAISEPSECLDS